MTLLLTALPTPVLTAVLTVYNVLLSAASMTLEEILQSATQLLTWVITGMGSVLTFVTSNPIVLVLFFIALISFVVGLLFRIWKSVG